MQLIAKIILYSLFSTCMITLRETVTLFQNLLIKIWLSCKMHSCQTAVILVKKKRGYFHYALLISFHQYISQEFQLFSVVSCSSLCLKQTLMKRRVTWAGYEAVGLWSRYCVNSASQMSMNLAWLKESANHTLMRPYWCATVSAENTSKSSSELSKH